METLSWGRGYAEFVADTTLYVNPRVFLMKTVSLIKHKREEGIQFPPYPITKDPHNFQNSWLIFYVILSASSYPFIILGKFKTEFLNDEYFGKFRRTLQSWHVIKCLFTRIGHKCSYNFLFWKILYSSLKWLYKCWKS